LIVVALAIAYFFDQGLGCLFVFRGDNFALLDQLAELGTFLLFALIDTQSKSDQAIVLTCGFGFSRISSDDFGIIYGAGVAGIGANFFDFEEF
jgi:hypothetical protein